MVNFKFLSQGFNSFINKMSTLITHQDLWTSKPSYDIIKYESTAVVSLQSLNALASAHLVKYSVAVMMYLALVCFPGGLIGPTKSIVHFSKACKVS
jgi:hypothetical protein